MIIFYEHDHSYWHGEDRLTSGTTFVNMFAKPYNREYWLKRGAVKNLIGADKLRDLKKQWQSQNKSVYTKSFIDYLLFHVDIEDFIQECESLSQQWDTKTELSCKKGTEYHLAREQASYRNGVERNPFDLLDYVVFQKPKCPIGDNCSLAENLYDLPDGYYPELLVSCLNYGGHEINLCGQADKIYLGTDEHGRYVDTSDFKTNDKLTAYAFRNEDTGKPETLLPPIQHLHDHKINKYALQISLYSWMLEQHGYRVRNTGIEHLNELIRTPYLKKEVESMISYYIENQLNKKNL